MTKQSVQSLVADIRLVSEQNYQIVAAVQSLVQQLFAACTEEVKYGGILFSSGCQFCGVFAYQAHVSVEFSCGAQIIDTFGLLEGVGKGRRHLKLHSVAAIEDKKLAEYLRLALQAAQHKHSAA